MNDSHPTGIESQDKPNVPDSNEILIGEIFSSPGPRKADDENGHPHDPELGEDSGGILMLSGEGAIAWVADGTSDTSRKGPFSSRILAQDLGRALTSGIRTLRPALQNETNGGRHSSLSELFQKSITDVETDWTRLLYNQSDLTKTLTNELAENARQSTGPVFYEFSATFSVALLDRHGNLHVAGIGDSYLVVSEQSRTQFFSMERGQVTLRLKIKGDRPEFETFSPPVQEIQANGVRLALLSTDGTRETVRFLYETLDGAIPPDLQSFLDLKKKIAHIKPRTQDDKTLALLGRFDEN